MPVGRHHFYVWDLKEAVRAAAAAGGIPKEQAGLVGEWAEAEEALGVAVEAARKVRDRLTAAETGVLVGLYPVLRPHLRPCHQKRFDREIKEPGDRFSMRVESYGENV